MELNYDVPAAIAFMSYQESTSLWHRRLGHLNLQDIKRTGNWRSFQGTIRCM